MILIGIPAFSLVDSALDEHVYEFERDSISLEVSVHLPESYETRKSESYPVIYLLDGYWTLEPMLGFYSNLRFDNMVPEMILVSISYPEDVEDVEEKRMWDLTHVYDSGFKAGGNAAILFDLIANSVTATIEKNYRADTTRTLLTGHSLAGLFTLYTMYRDPGLFTHYAAISPSALWGDNALANLDSVYAKNCEDLPAKVYITYGTGEYAPYVNSLKNYTRLLERREYGKLELTLAKVEGLRHVGMTSEGFLRGLIWSVADIAPGSPSGFETMNRKALERQ